MEIERTDGTSTRVLRGWELDAEDNVTTTWAGDVSSTGPDAVNASVLSFDDPVNPTATTVTPPMGSDVHLPARPGHGPVNSEGSHTALSGSDRHSLYSEPHQPSSWNFTLPMRRPPNSPTDPDRTRGRAPSGGAGVARPSFARYWAKTSSDGAFHPLACHGLDVAASGRRLLRAKPLLLHRLATTSGIQDRSTLVDFVTFLLAIHDLGKIADSFQGLRNDLMQELQGRTSQLPYGAERHDLLGFRLWSEIVLEREALRSIVIPEGDDPDDWADLTEPWIHAVMGHHGAPVRPSPVPGLIDELFPEPVLGDVRRYLTWLAEHFLPGGLPFRIEPFQEQCEAFRRASWLVAGLAVVADWLGSNRGWFELCPGVQDLDDYWDRAGRLARVAIQEAGLTDGTISRAGGLRTLWPQFREPTELQALAETLRLDRGPQILVIEEVTGGGKTEGASVLAHRLMDQGEGNGLYLALPTMATANAMYHRVATLPERLYEGGASPSMILAHSKSHLTLGLEDARADDGHTEEQPSASQQCSEWLADSLKKALLAHLGVGTIDQALVAVLPVPHQSLRIWGVVGKVLLVDEVHACDHYVRRLLCRLLEFHGGMGGSTILLSATLPSQQRQELLEAFARGAGFQPPPSAQSLDYPLVSHLGRSGLSLHPVSARPEASRRVEVVPVRSRAAAEREIEATLEEGGCACWVVNTVRDAIDVYDRWRERIPEERLLLFHSRFTVGDRIRIEEEVERYFGRESTAADRKGHLLIATQVVEQSLDLDFDLMVTDLAPIDLIVQRAGRLRRHARDRKGGRIEGPDQRGPARLLVYTPEPVADAGDSWLPNDLVPTSRVYEDLGELWLTARWLEDHGGFDLSRDARDLIESVYGPQARERVPVGLAHPSRRAESRRREERALATGNALELDDGYGGQDGAWLGEEYTPTRLGEPTVTVRLVRREGDEVRPWNEHEEYGWELSSLQVRRSWVAAVDPRTAAKWLPQLRNRLPDRAERSVLVVLEQRSDCWSGRAVAASGDAVHLTYTRPMGLHLEM